MAFDPFKCPTSLDLPDFSDKDVCQTSIDQIQKLALQKTTGAAFTTTTIKSSSAWATAIADTDPDLIVVSPYLQKVTITPGDVIETADVNNLNGIPQHEGFGFTVVTAEIHNAPHTVISEFKKIATLTARQAGQTQAKAYFFGENSRITAGSTGDGIPVYNMVVSDVMSEGKRKPNVHKLRFLLPDGWSESINTFEATFDPTTL